MTVEEILAALQAIMDQAVGRDLTPDEIERYEDLEGKLTAARRSAEIRARDAAYRAVAPSVAASVHVGVAKQDDTLDRAFDHYMRTGMENQDIQELRAQSLTTTAGGYLVPQGFRQKLVERLKAFGGIAPEVEEITTTEGNDLPWPTLDDTANKGVRVSTNSAPTTGSGADLVFGQKTLHAYSYQAPGGDNVNSENRADGLRVPRELVQDSAFDIQALVLRRLTMRINRLQADDWITGTGSSQPQGITLASGVSKTFTAAAIDYPTLVAAVHTLDPEYRLNAKWAFNDTTLAAIRALVDGSQRPLWLPQTEAGLIDLPGGTLLGYPVVIDQSFPNYTDGSGNKWGVFGDLQQAYVIRRVQAVEMIVDPYTRAHSRQILYTLWARADGLVQDDYAVSVLKND